MLLMLGKCPQLLSIRIKFSFLLWNLKTVVLKPYKTGLVKLQYVPDQTSDDSVCKTSSCVASVVH